MSTDASQNPTDLMSVSELARSLADKGDPVERSTLSRYVNNHGLVRQRRGRSALCSLSEVRAHRQQNGDRVAMGGAALVQSNPAVSASGVADASQSPGLPPSPVASATPSTPASPPGELVEPADLAARRRSREAKAMQDELDLARDLGLVVERAEVEAGVASAIGRFNRSILKDADDAADKTIAELQLPTGQAPALRLQFRRFANSMRAKLAEECTSMAGDIGRDAPCKTEAGERLVALIGYARELMPDPDDMIDTPISQTGARA